MRIFVYEFTSATPAAPDLPSSLRAEGKAMLMAVLADLQRIDDVETCTLLADSLHDSVCPRSYLTGHNERAAFTHLTSTADCTLVIAPEFDDILATRSAWVTEAGGLTLNATVEAIRLTGDKLELARHLAKANIPTPATAAFSVARPALGVLFPAVLKPRHGAGSQSTFLVQDAQQLNDCLAAASSEGPAADMILQPYVPGRAASVAFLTGPAGAIPLWPAAQHLSADGRFRYLGGTVPLPETDWPRAQALAGRAIAAVPGLCGYVGVDLILGDAADGGGDAIIEINPRLTTSYIGLRRIATTNLADALLRVAKGDAAVSFDSLSRRPASTVRFDPDGRCEVVGTF